MPKILLTTDDHFTSGNFDKQMGIYKEIVIPEARKNGIKRIFNLGDFTDKRVGLDALLQYRLWNEFIPLIVENDLEVHFLTGNHQLFYKDRTDIHTLEMFKHLPEEIQKHFKVLDEQMTMKLEGSETLIQIEPWLINYKDFVLHPDAKIVLGHFEVAGAYMTKSYFIEKGQDHKSLLSSKNVELVLSGHYHIKQQVGKHIHYLGNTFQKDWNDYAEKKGIHILDVDSLELEFIENNISPRFIKMTLRDNPFVKGEYQVILEDGLNLSEEFEFSDLDSMKDLISGNHVKVIIKETENFRMSAKLKAFLYTVSNQLGVLSSKVELSKLEETKVELEVIGESQKEISEVLMEALKSEDKKVLLNEILQEIKDEVEV